MQPAPLQPLGALGCLLIQVAGGCNGSVSINFGKPLQLSQVVPALHQLHDESNESCAVQLAYCITEAIAEAKVLTAHCSLLTTTTTTTTTAAHAVGWHTQTTGLNAADVHD